MYSADFMIFRRISVTRQFLVSLTSIVGQKCTMEVNETRNYLFTDILLNIRDGFEKSKNQQFNSGGVVK